jgi:hypothetical protein
MHMILLILWRVFMNNGEIDGIHGSMLQFNKKFWEELIAYFP